MNQMPEMLDDMLDTLEEQGARFPIYLAVIAANDTALVNRFGEDRNADALCEYAQDAGADFRLPINLIFVDAAGEGYRA
jgi:hypothetical protein